MKPSLFFLCLFTMAFTGCAASEGFHRDELREELGGAPVANDEAIAAAFANKAQLPKPFRLAVYFEKSDRALMSWRWTEGDKSVLLTAIASARDSRELSEAFLMTEATVTGTDLHSLRLAAARHGADALLVVSGAVDVDRYNNGWGWTYAAILPAFFVPGSVTDLLFITEATLWDVRNEHLYATAEAESIKRQTRPAAFSDERTLLQDAKSESIGKLREELARQISALTASKVAGN